MPAPEASTPSGPQTSSQPIPAAITTTKALTIEIAKVPDGRPFDPHWTTYLQATATPVVAVIAAVIAATIQWRQWKTATAAAETAKNKLKLDLFDKRMVVFDAAVHLVRRANLEAPMDLDDFSELTTKMRQAEWLFSREVASRLDDITTRALERIVLTTAHDKSSRLPDNQLHLVGSKGSIDRFNAAYNELRELFNPYLSLSH
ncbi:hypothetical protein ACTJKJ_18550 [Roseateles sp. 22389]|uniref:hypothetical protein n=1 Tax=Roseateles sp. 22389 TaxID=3453916 RepID=UPI003F873ADC